MVVSQGRGPDSYDTINFVVFLVTWVALVALGFLHGGLGGLLIGVLLGWLPALLLGGGTAHVITSYGPPILILLVVGLILVLGAALWGVEI